VQINNAAVINPDLLRETNAQDRINIFNADSISILLTLDNLKSLVRDSINIKIVTRLDHKLRGDLSWIIKSNVPDSMIHHAAKVHLENLEKIHELIQHGKSRTEFLQRFQKARLHDAFMQVAIFIVVIILLSFLLLLLAIFNLHKQQSKRKEKEIELVEKDFQFHRILNNMLEGIQIHDFNWKYTYVNDSLAKYSKCSKEELLGKTLLEKYPGIEQTDLFRTLERCMKNRMAEHLETEFIFPDGSKADYELSIQPVPEGLFILSIDITQRKKAEQEIISSETRFRSVVENMHESLIIEDTAGKLIYANTEFSKTFGFENDELKTLSLKDYTSPSSYLEIIERHNKRIKGLPVEDEFVYKGKRKDGTEIWIEARVSPILENGKITGTLSLERDITERKYSEQKILKANRLYKFLSSINQSIVQVNNEQDLLENVCMIAAEIGEFKLAYIGLINERDILNITHLSGDKIAAKHVLKSHLDCNDPALQQIPTVKVLKTGKYNFNNDIQNDPTLEPWKEGFIQHGIRACISFPLFKSGKVIGIFGFHSTVKDFFDTEEIALLEEAASDISFAIDNFEKAKKHFETEELVVKNEKRFRSLIEKSSDMKTLTSAEGIITYASPSVIKSFGFTLEELLNKKAVEFFHEEDIPEIIKKRNEILDRPGGTYMFTQRLRHKNGSWIWCEGTVTNLLFEPAIQAMVTNFRDITEKRSIEQQRLFDKNNLTALMNSTHDMMWSIDREFRLITFNSAFEESIKAITGIAVEAGTLLLNEKFDDQIIDPYRTFYNRALSGETFTEIIDHELTGIHWSEVSFYPIYSSDHVVGTACFLRDITERKKSEEQLAKNTLEKEIFIKELSQNNKDLQQFAYITSHNLRGPVASLLGLVNLLDGFNLKDKTLVQILSGIKKASLNFDETIKDLNTILSAKDNLNLKSESILFETSLRKALEQCDNQIKESKAEIIYNFDLSPQVSFNRSYLESIFMNLLTNAFKYRDPLRNLKISVQTKTGANFVIMTFSDNGIGMDVELHKEKIFKLYQRFHTHNEGKGLGLFLIKSQLEAFGGTITVESEINRGTQFIIHFRKI